MSSGKHLGKGSQIPSLPDDGQLRLYSMRFCPFAHRIHLVLNAKEIPYHTIFIDLNEKPEWLTEKSPSGLVPALELTTEPNNPTITESLLVADYLDEKYPTPQLYPKDPLQKVQDRLLIQQLSALTGAIYKLFYDDLENASEHFEKASVAIDAYEKELNKRNTTFFGGKQPGMVDYMIWPWYERFEMKKSLLSDQNDFDEERFPKLADWMTLMKGNPAVKQHYLDGETHAKFLKSRHSGKPDFNMLA